MMQIASHMLLLARIRGYNRFAIGQIQKNGADHHFSSGNTIASLVNNVYQTDQGRLAYPARESYHLASDFAISK